MDLAYTANPLDRRANDRSDLAWLAAQLRSPQRRLVRINGDRAVMTADGSLDLSWSTDAADLVLLGTDADGAPWFAGRTTSETNLRDLRSLAMEAALPPGELGILAQARSLIQWHERRTFCSNCGNRNEVADAGYRRHCPSCGMDHFPRTDPVVIIVVRHAGRILLGRQKAWRPGMYSALAGFMEPGETIEDAARREVFEEAGIRVGAVRYVASQPWPFLSNLMIGLIGEAETAGITLDPNEIEDARWFSDEEALLMVEGRHPDGLTAATPMAIAHHLVRTALGLPSD